MNLRSDCITEKFELLCIKYSNLFRIVDASEIDTLLGAVSGASFTEYGTCGCVFPQEYVCEDSCPASIPDEVNRLLDELRRLYGQLEEIGMSHDDVRCALWQEAPVSRLEVKDNLCLCFPDYAGKVVRLPRMQYVLYCLFLNHPEGIMQKELSDYVDELRIIYIKSFRHMGGSFNRLLMEQKLRNITDASSHTLIEYISHIRKTIVAALGSDSLARHYYIRGTRNHRYGITISRDFVT